MRLALFALLAVQSFAKDPPLPQITAELRAKFWRAQAEELAAKLRLDAIRGEIAKTCAPRQVVSGVDGEPQCETK